MIYKLTSGKRIRINKDAIVAVYESEKSTGIRLSEGDVKYWACVLTSSGIVYEIAMEFEMFVKEVYGLYT